MARDHGRVNVTIWQDADFRALSPSAQHLYLLLWCHPELTYCGSIDWRPGKLAPLAGGWTKDAVLDAAGELMAGVFLIVDDETEEALLRSWIKWDGLMKQPRLAVSMVKAYSSLASNTLRGVVVHELLKLRDRHPELPAWGDDRVLSVLSQPSISPPVSAPVTETFTPGFGGEFGPNATSRLDTPYSSSYSYSTTPKNNDQTPFDPPASNNKRKRRDYPPDFEQFWNTYPRNASKPAAFKAWMSATQREDHETILNGAHRYATDPNLPGEALIPHAATWLNNDRWNDGPLPTPDGSPSSGLWGKEGPF